MCNKVTTKNPGLTGLNGLKVGCEVSHFNRVLTRRRSDRPEFKKNKLCEDLWRYQKLCRLRNEFQSLLFMSLKKSLFRQKRPASPSSGQIPIKTTGLMPGLQMS